MEPTFGTSIKYAMRWLDNRQHSGHEEDLVKAKMAAYVIENQIKGREML